MDPQYYYTAYQQAGLTTPPPPPEMQDWHHTIGLTQQEPDYLIHGSVKKVAMGLGWDAGCDVDGSVVLFDQNHQMVDTVWFKNLKSRDGAVSHSGDDQTGEGGGDDEVIKVKLAKLHRSVHHLLFVVCVYTRGVTFSQVRSAYVRMLHGKKKHKGHVLSMFNLSNMRGNAMLMGLLTRKGAYWNFRALGTPAAGRTVVEVVRDPVSTSCLQASPSHDPVIYRIHISVQEGRDLIAKDKSIFSKKGSSDPYVQLRYDKKKMKSDVIKKNLNPRWNMPPMDLGLILESENKAVKITVWDYDLGGDDFMGTIRIPASAMHKAGLGDHEWWFPLTTPKDKSNANHKVKGDIKVMVMVRGV